MLSLIAEGYSGTPCLPREDIYPCTCTSVQMNKKTIFTVVTCSHITSSSALFVASINFRRMEIDRFILIDSFLEAKKLYGNDAEKHQTLPLDWLSRLKIRELEVIDSAVSARFMCESSAKCRNSYQTHLSVTNSSESSSIDTICVAANQARFSWTGCMTRLKFFSFSGNHLSTFERGFFPEKMSELTDVILSSNKISKVGKDAFKNLPKLSTLDLSHNEIKDITGEAFGNALIPHLKFLDLSYNQIQAVSSSIIKIMPSLGTLNVHNNLIRKVKEADWKGLSTNIRTINLTDNPVCCDCDLAWLNASLAVHANVLGDCETPERFQESTLRQASRLLHAACNDPVKKKDITACPP